MRNACWSISTTPACWPSSSSSPTDGLLANEIAPRVHNSGHWSIEGAECSQFENHLRAIAGLPLGADRAARRVADGELHRQRAASRRPWPQLEGVHVHLYGKLPKPQRKIGHATLTAADSATLEARLRRLEPLLDQNG